MPGKGASANIIKHVGMAVETFQQLIESAVGADAVEELIHFQQQTIVVTAGQRPGHGLRRAQIKPHMHGGIEGLVDDQFVGIDHRKVDLVIVDHAQQIHDFQIIRLLEHQLRMFDLQLA